MAVNKVIINTPSGEKVLMDVTGDTVTPETLAEGVTAHDASGNKITGTMPIETILYTEQSLTDEQKAQARENIGVDEEYKANLVQAVIETLGGNPVFGYVDENNNIVLSGNVADGTYSVKYEMEDGSTVDIGSLVLAEGEEPEEIVNLAVPNETNTTDWSIWCNDARIGSDGNYRANAGYTNVSNYIPVKKGDTVYWSGMNVKYTDAGSTQSCFYDSGKNMFGSYGTMESLVNSGYIADVSINGTSGQFTTVADGVAYFRFGMLKEGTDLNNVIVTVNQPIS